MSKMDAITAFYCNQIPDGKLKNNILQAPCPFCTQKDGTSQGQLVVFLSPDSFFHGYFYCSNHCIPGGFPLYYSRLLTLNMMSVPGYDPDREYASTSIEYPVKNINADIQSFMDRMTDEQYAHFNKMGISRETLQEMKIGYNGRYLIYPYVEEDGNYYCARLIHPDRIEENFWFGAEEFADARIMRFKKNDFDRC